MKTKHKHTYRISNTIMYVTKIITRDARSDNLLTGFTVPVFNRLIDGKNMASRESGMWKLSVRDNDPAKKTKNASCMLSFIHL